jgi:hypothetical protein
MTSIFVSYNPNSDREQTQAVRFHTIGAVNGFQMYLPDRSVESNVSEETRRRIRASEYFIAFVSGQITPTLHAELLLASKLGLKKNQIIVIRNGKNSKPVPPTPFSEFYLDASKDTVEEFYARIIESIKQDKPKRNNEQLGMLILAGLAIWGLATVFGSKK